ncbi:MAG: phosphate transport system regulatory protein PhoU [Pedobacter sp.]|jgi:phosphate transport system protein|nr:phosphate transport system regulatory protein PhoU [Pedobacter sp.]
MKQLEKELESIKTELINMWELVSAQVSSSRDCLTEFDKDLAREIQVKEKRVNSAELNIDQDCENVFALYSPVAVDLRFLLSILKINSNLERVGDIADGIAKYIIDADVCFKPELLTVTRIMDMFEVGTNMLKITLLGFEREDTVLARSIFKMDEVLDEINSNANANIIEYLKKYPEDLDQALYALSIIRKLERVGDQVKNIAEEIIFYIEAKVIKHRKQE